MRETFVEVINPQAAAAGAQVKKSVVMEEEDDDAEAAPTLLPPAWEEGSVHAAVSSTAAAARDERETDSERNEGGGGEEALALNIGGSGVGKPEGEPKMTEDWVRYCSPEGHYWYYNEETGESKWEAPEDFLTIQNQQQQFCQLQEQNQEGKQNAPFDLSDPNARNSKGESALHLVSGLCFLDGMRLLVENGADVNCVDFQGRRPLHAVCGGTGSDPVEACVEVLLLAGADPGAPDSSGRTPLHAAAAAGRAEVVSMLLRAGAVRGAVDEDGNTALHLSAVNGYLEVMQLLVLWKEVEQQQSSSSSCCGRVSDKKDCQSQHSRPETYVSDLSESEGALMGESLTVTPTPSEGGRTRSPSPVPHASHSHSQRQQAPQQGQEQYPQQQQMWMQCKTDHGDIYFYNTTTGESQWENPSGEKEEQGFNLGHGPFYNNGSSSCSGQQDQYASSRDFITSSGSCTETLHQEQQELEQQRQHLRVWDKFFENATRRNMNRRRGMKRPKNKPKECSWPLPPEPDELISLADLARSPSAPASAQAAALIAAATVGDAACLEGLLMRGLPPNCIDEALRTPMHHAAHQGSVSCLSVLWEYGADIDSRDERGNTPLMEASIAGKKDCSLFLLKSAAAIDVGNYRGDTALHAAVMNGQLESVKTLVRYGCQLDPRNNISLTPISAALALPTLGRKPPPGLQSAVEYLEWEIRRNIGSSTGIGGDDGGGDDFQQNFSKTMQENFSEEARMKHRRLRRRRKKASSSSTSSKQLSLKKVETLSSSTSSYSLSLDDLDYRPPSKHLPMPPHYVSHSSQRQGLPPPLSYHMNNSGTSYTEGGWGALQSSLSMDDDGAHNGGGGAGVWKEAVGLVGRMIFGSSLESSDEGNDNDEAADNDGRGGHGEEIRRLAATAHSRHTP